jgi:hypothetical protein
VHRARHVAISVAVAVAVAVAAGAGAGGAPALAAPLTAAGSAASAKPVIDSVQPATGPTAGGTSVQIFGSGLKGATSVNFGSAAASITSDSASEVDVVSPQHASGAVDITVTTAAGPAAVAAPPRETGSGGSVWAAGPALRPGRVFKRMSDLR